MWIAETIDLGNHDSVVKFMKSQSDKIKKLEEENEQLKQQLTDCEKFRHAVYQRISKEMTQHD